MSEKEFIESLYSAFPAKLVGEFEFIDADFSPDIAKVLIIHDFSCNGGKHYSFAFVGDFLSNGGILASRCWITEGDKSKIKGIRPYPDYEQFNHATKEFFPFSVNLTKYTDVNAEKLKDICIRLYLNNILHHE